DDGRTMAESGAIVEYLVNVYGQGRLVPPAASDDRLRYTYWMHYAEGSLMPLLLLRLVFSRISRPPMPLLLRPVARAIEQGVRARLLDPQLALHMNFLEAELARSEWFAGAQFSAADIQMSFPLEAAQKRGALRADHQRLQRWLEVIRSRPAYRRAIERGGPYSLLD
ncbi:MAG TPA: glutathione S-transferase C-terminal domain-containing protein, partial [Burkholderiaceae bacterium]|nr:glutathione S-transferase C-terminal domain-containing protein [Burkholderiaceae bacterium]